MQKLLVLLLFVFLSCKEATQTTIPTLGSITESVYASGVIKAENQYTVFATVSGVIQTIDVMAGEDITSGETLFELENDKGRLATENARLTYELSEQNSQYIQSKIDEYELLVQLAAAKLETDRSFYERNKKAQQYGGITAADFEKITLTYNSSKLNLASSKKQLSQLRAQLKNEQTKNKVSLQINQKNQSDYNIKSAVSGQVFDVLVKKGALVTLQTPLAIIGEKNAFVIELEVDENDMVSIALQQLVLITMDSYKNQVFEARIDNIYPIMDSQSRTFKIEAHFIQLPKQLYPNLSAEGNIIIQTKKNTLIIPRDYLMEPNSVLVNKTEKRKVKTGLSDYEHVEITAGLQPNEIIYKPK